MCGVAGLYRPGGLAERDAIAVAAMTGALAHRGPDASSVWTDAPAGMALGHRRLSIIDLSPAGAQPMASASGRYSIAFNGEIYNFGELRAELEEKGLAPAWRGHSDTEALLAAIEAFGLEGALARTRGMFALGLFDRQTGALTLARDAFGEKPLYVARIDDAVVFASELKGLKAHPAWRGEIDRQALTAFIRHGYISAPATIYAGVSKLRPGAFCVIDAQTAHAPLARETLWYDALALAGAARRAPFAGDAAAATAELDRLLHASIARQAIADVPVGAFLSGGIDSSTVAAIMQAQRATPIETFALGFVEEAFNEAPYAREVARCIGSSHNEIVLSADHARDLVATMPDVYDEPFADPSQLPTSMIAAFARTKVTVALSGDAGDELFAGYGRYHAIARRWSGGVSGAAIRTASSAYANLLLAAVVAPAQALGFSRVAGRALAPLRMRLEGLAARSGARSALEAYERSFTVVDQAHRFVRGAKPVVDPLIAQVAAQPGWSVLEQATLYDTLRYLPDDILVKVDRAAMAHSLETRVPLLDTDVAAFAWSLPDELRMLGGERKGLLKAVLGKYVPRALWDRPKRGFGVPAAAWLAGPFRPLASDLFSRANIERQGLLNADAVVTVWEDFLSGGQRRVNLVWTLFVLQLYLTREL
ncbi:MAG: hypothetical protein JWN93_1305 [Hyphomicrobiales bacterium]|nr:hypothetical protein [Hyphomicrobiales bacterium]